ncbi:MAG TPA: hypothetical protein VI485_25135 [Vicinamibacterales bacterium]|nr:hypothetical protein [Vicinamibacterales bacterium]
MEKVTGLAGRNSSLTPASPNVIDGIVGLLAIEGYRDSTNTDIDVATTVSSDKYVQIDDLRLNPRSCVSWSGLG